GARRAVKRFALAVAVRLWLPLLLILIWEAVTRAVGEAYFPPPSEILAALHELWFSGPPSRLFMTEEALEDFGPSLFSLFAGWLLTGLAGVVIGVALGLARTVVDVVEPYVHVECALHLPTPSHSFLQGVLF